MMPAGSSWVVDFVPIDKVQMVELHRLHMLRPAIINALHSVLFDFSEWRIEDFVRYAWKESES